MRKSIWFLILILWGCNDIEDCQLNPYRDMVKLRVNHDQDVVFDSLTVSGFGRIVDFPDSATVIFDLPVDFDANQVEYSFFTDSLTYSLTLSYDREIKIYELNCDPSVRYFDLMLEESSFDSTVVIGEELNTAFIVNVEVYIN